MNDADSNDQQAYFLRVKAQLLFPEPGILRALWHFQYKPRIGSSAQLTSCSFKRLNAHEGYIDYIYELRQTTADNLRTDGHHNDTSTKDRRDDSVRGLTASGPRITFNDIAFSFRGNDARREARKRSRAAFLNDTLVDAARAPLAHRTTIDGVFFWESVDWWQARTAAANPTQLWFHPADSLSQRRRTARLLNTLARSLMQREAVRTVDNAVDVLARSTVAEVDFAKKLYVEPSASSLFASYLSTTFMHHKQQHGLNTKHAAGKCDSSAQQSVQSQHSSVTPFDQKIYLDMCSSCDKKDIFEIMLKMPSAEHANRVPCDCEFCGKLREIANAWRIYDCTDRVWLRLEFNRRMYNIVANLIAQQPRVDIVFFSYKNEFHERDKFIANFVNYYSFYENNERPVGEHDLHGALREKISIIFVFAVVNWKLIVNAIERRKMHNSISLNQQSIFKSLDNTLYAIFSENSINRMAKETQQRVLNINAPYINRGFGALPNCGVNAFTTVVS